jgi:anti-sigma B factor antagonist
MTVRKEKNGNQLTVTIAGNIDINTAPELKAQLEGELSDITSVIFDLKEVLYISSAGLRVLLRTFQIMDEKDGHMVLKNVNSDFYSILKISGFTDFLDVEKC